MFFLSQEIFEKELLPFLLDFQYIYYLIYRIIILLASNRFSAPPFPSNFGVYFKDLFLAYSMASFLMLSASHLCLTLISLVRSTLVFVRKNDLLSRLHLERFFNNKPHIPCHIQLNNNWSWKCMAFEHEILTKNIIIRKKHYGYGQNRINRRISPSIIKNIPAICSQ